MAHALIVLFVGALLGRPEFHDVLRLSWESGHLDTFVHLLCLCLPYALVFALGVLFGTFYKSTYRVSVSHQGAKPRFGGTQPADKSRRSLGYYTAK